MSAQEEIPTDNRNKGKRFFTDHLNRIEQSEGDEHVYERLVVHDNNIRLFPVEQFLAVDFYLPERTQGEGYHAPERRVVVHEYALAIKQHRQQKERDLEGNEEYEAENDFKPGEE